MKLFKSSLLLFMAFFSFACTNTNILGTKSKTEKQFQTIVETSVNTEEEIYSIGRGKIKESGMKVARMTSVEDANKILKEKIQDKSYALLENFSEKANIYEKRFNKKIMKNLSEYVATKVLENSETKKEWEYDTGEIFVLITVEKNDVVKRTKDIFVEHIDKILTDLKKVQQEASVYEEGNTGVSSEWIENNNSDKTETEELHFDI